jgi:ABC-type Zn uptake system ZnuABC Zn-binding protein ZnuA
VRTVFFETLVSPRLAQTVARESGATTAVLNPLEGLTADEREGRGRRLLQSYARISRRDAPPSKEVALGH